MRSNSLLALLSTLTTIAIASPTPPSLTPRACTTILPTTYQQINQDNPGSSYPQSRQFYVERAPDPGYDIDTLVHFTGIPANAYGCQLAVSFTYEYNIYSTGNPQLNVYKVATDIFPESNYIDYFPPSPAAGGYASGAPNDAVLFGTTTLNGGQAVINSGVCSPDMSFLFEIAGEGAGSVLFVDAGDNLTGIGGFYLTYGC